MKKNKPVTIIVSVCLIACLVFLSAFAWRNTALIKELPQRLHIGDRLTLHVNAESDGRRVKLNDGSVTCVFDDEQESRVRFCCLTDKCESYSIPGGEYGEYIFTICLEEAEIKVTVFNTNWWNVADIILICGIDTECHTMTYVLEDQHGVVSAEEDGKTYVIGTMI